MTRRKSVCLRWTLVIVVISFCANVETRPQDTSASSVTPEISTERYRLNSHNTWNSRLPIVISTKKSTVSDHFDLLSPNRNSNVNIFNIHIDSFTNSNDRPLNRTSRLIKSVVVRDMTKNNLDRKPKPSQKVTNKPKTPLMNDSRPKPLIRRVITKWKDKTKFDDINFSYETTTSEESHTTFYSISQPNEYTSTESTNDEPVAKKRYPSKYITAVYKPQNEFSEETQVYSTNVQIVDKFPTQSTYMHTKRPSPTPEITNVGYPKPWHTPKPQIKKPTTQKPVQVTRPLNYNYHNSKPNYASDYEVSTFEPASAYTEKIVIRPEEYSGSNYDCPTIYLTLNNTFQGQAKEACPDLNIAVNTNVVNKNNVIDSDEEEDPDSLFPNTFGIPVGGDSEAEDFAGADYFGSTEDQAQGESASVEGTELANYNAANAIQSESAEPGGLFSPSSPISALSKPGRPDKDDDDIFSFSSLVQFFRPVINVLGWLVRVNPFTIGLFPLFLAPIALLFAGSGLATLFTPWFLPLGREAPTVIHVYRPYWHWDDTIKTWHLHSFPDNRRWKPLPRSSLEKNNDPQVKHPVTQKIKTWLFSIAKNLKDRVSLSNNNNYVSSEEHRKIKRKRRETWTRRVK